MSYQLLMLQKEFPDTVEAVKDAAAYAIHNMELNRLGGGK